MGTEPTKPFAFCVKQMNKATLSAAIKHNRRTIPCKNADATRSHRNLILAGPKGAAEVIPLAESMVKATGSKPRKNASWGIELIFSLAPNHRLDERAYFECCLLWAANRFGMENILSADVHLDEPAPHCHILILALRDGKLQGSAILGGKADLHAMRRDFLLSVKNPLGVSTRNPTAASPSKHLLGDLPNQGNKSYVLLGDSPASDQGKKQVPRAFNWLSTQLDCVQSVKVLKIEAEKFGYSMADLITARQAIGDVRVAHFFGVDYWQLPRASDQQRQKL